MFEPLLFKYEHKNMIKCYSVSHFLLSDLKNDNFITPNLLKEQPSQSVKFSMI